MLANSKYSYYSISRTDTTEFRCQTSVSRDTQITNSLPVSTCRGGEFGSAADHKRSSAMPSQGSLFTNFEDVQVSNFPIIVAHKSFHKGRNIRMFKACSPFIIIIIIIINF